MTTLIRHRLQRSSGQEGFIIVAVLWILMALATLATVFSVYVANSAVAVAVKDDAIQGELLVASSLELVAYQLGAPVKAPQRKPTRGAFRFRAAQATVTVSFAAETARVDLNYAPKVALAGLFGALGAPDQAAQFYADRIIGWRTAPNPADPENEDTRYRAAALPYGPRGAPFAHPDELRLLLGVPSELVERMMPFVTIYSGRPEINVFDAPPEVLAALPSMTPDRLGALLDLRERAPVDPDTILRLLGSGQTGATVEGSDAVRVRVDIKFDKGRHAVSEVVVLMNADEEPYRVLSWRDEIDAAAAGQSREGTQ